MSGEDGGWGGTVDDGWAGPTPLTGNPQPHQGAVPPYLQSQPPYVAPPQFAGPTKRGAPALPGQQGPRRGGTSTRLLGVVVAAVVVIAAIVIAVVASSGNSKSTSQPSHSTSSQSSAPSSSVTTPLSNSTSIKSVSLLSIVPFSGCQQAPPSTYSTSSVTEGVGCSGSDVKNFSADEVDYQHFSNASALAEWYQQNIIAANQIVSNTGDCSTTRVITTSKSAQYCEGGFTDSSGDDARQLLVIAPASAVITDNKTSSATACPTAASYTVLFFTSPADNVGVSVLACNGTAEIANGFERALQDGTLDLNQ